MYHLKSFCMIFTLIILASTLRAQSTVEVYIHQPDRTEQRVLEELEKLVSQEDRFTLDYSYSDSEQEELDYQDSRLVIIQESLEQFEWLFLVDVLKLTGTADPQFAVSIVCLYEGLLFDQDIIQVASGSPAAVARTIYDKLVYYEYAFLTEYDTGPDNAVAALASELQTYLTMAVQYWKTPVSQGGAGGDPNNMSIRAIKNFVGLSKGWTKIDNYGFLEVTYSRNNLVKMEAYIDDIYQENGYIRVLIGTVDVRDGEILLDQVWQSTSD